MLTDEFLDQVFDQHTAIPNAKLVSLSELAEPEAEKLRLRWTAQPMDIRANLVDRLFTIAEDNPETNFDAIFRIALDDAAPELRVKGIESLWECNERWLLNTLTALAEDDLEPEVRATACTHLERFTLAGAQGELRPSLVEKVEGTLRRIFDNPREDSPVRRRALEGLGPSADEGVNDRIRTAYHSADHELKLGALYAMGQHYDSQWLPVLLTELKSADPAVRFEAARACGGLEDERAIPALAEMVRGGDPEVQEAAITSFGQIGGATAKRLLQDILNNGNTRMKEAAKAALEELAFGEDPMSLR